MSTRGSKFNWACLNRRKLADYIWKISEKIIKKNLKVNSFHLMVARHLRNYIPVIISKKFEYTRALNSVRVGGLYYSHRDQNHQRSIEILFLYNPISEFLNLSKSAFWSLCWAIADTVLHEIIHMRQARRREFKFIPEYQSSAKNESQKLAQIYLGNPDEIDAYGFSISCSLYDEFGEDPAVIMNYLNSSTYKGYKNADWQMYVLAFEQDAGHMVINRLKKKILQYLKHAKKGKPYRNSEWIWY